MYQAIRQEHTDLLLPTVIRSAIRSLGVAHALVEEHGVCSILVGESALVVEQHGSDSFLTSRSVRQVEERVVEAVAVVCQICWGRLVST